MCDSDDEPVPHDPAIVWLLAQQNAHGERQARLNDYRRSRHYSECENTPPSFEDVVRALEEDR